jgi:hypothetical protein
MKQYLTRDEIYDRFESEWVLLENPKTDKHHRVLGGTLLCHSKNRDEVYRKGVELKPKRAAILYTGKIPKGTAVIL